MPSTQKTDKPKTSRSRTRRQDRAPEWSLRRYARKGWGKDLRETVSRAAEEHVPSFCAAMAEIHGDDAKDAMIGDDARARVTAEAILRSLLDDAKAAVDGGEKPWRAFKDVNDFKSLIDEGTFDIQPKRDRKDGKGKDKKGQRGSGKVSQAAASEARAAADKAASEADPLAA